jgi:hypothetical protein
MEAFMAKGLISINLRSIPVTVIGTISRRIIDVIGSYLSADPYVMGIVNKINAVLKNLTQVSSYSPSSSYTTKVSEKDQIRDKRYNGFVHLINNKKLMYDDPAIIRAADVLLHIIDKLGSGVANSSYSRETQLLNILFEELKTAPAIDAIRVLGIAAEVELLLNAQKDFNDVVKSKVDELAAQDSPGSIETYRKLYRYMSMVLAHINYNAEEGEILFAKCVPALNEIIKEANLSGAHQAPPSDDTSKTEMQESVAAI